MSVGANVRRLRTGLGMSQKQLADAVSITQSMVAQVERGTKSLTIELGNDIAHVLGVPIGQLVDAEEDSRSQRAVPTP